jgi:sugar lactone lactonase YvrE
MVTQRSVGSFLLALFVAACATEPPGFDTPESALHDPVADVYLVSNIHGKPLERDNNGYIARVRPDGGMQRYWVQGGKGGVTLHAPKGMALAGDVLWVADIDTVRRFDRTSGRPLGETKVPGASFLNDLAIGPDGTVWVTDMGVDATFAPTGTDAIWRVSGDGAPVALVRGPELGLPNGLVATQNALYVVNWRDGTFFQVDYRGVRTDLAKAPAAQLDGLVRVELPAAAGQAAQPAYWLATSWAGKCVVRFDATGGVSTLPLPLEQPADCGLDAVRRRLLVPLFGSNRLELLPL